MVGSEFVTIASMLISRRDLAPAKVEIRCAHPELLEPHGWPRRTLGGYEAFHPRPDYFQRRPVWSRQESESDRAEIERDETAAER